MSNKPKVICKICNCAKYLHHSWSKIKDHSFVIGQKIAKKTKIIIQIEPRVNYNPLLEKFEPVNPMYSRLFSNKTERASLDRIIKQLGYDRVEKIIDHLPIITSKPYAPKITKPTELERDLGKLIVFIRQQQSQQKPSKMAFQ